MTKNTDTLTDLLSLIIHDNRLEKYLGKRSIIGLIHSIVTPFICTTVYLDAYVHSLCYIFPNL